jgi:hypothetical protein
VNPRINFLILGYRFYGGTPRDGGANNIGGPNPDFEKYVILGETFGNGNLQGNPRR